MSDNDIRQSDWTRAKMDLKPDAMKSSTEKAADETSKVGDAIASVVPGQEKTRDHFTDNAVTPNLTHDHGRAGGLEGVTPSGEVGVGGFVKQKIDQAASYVQPEKSNTQEARDALTPGNHSAKQEEGKGLLATAGEALTSVKDTVAGAFGVGSDTTSPADRSV